MDQPAASVGRLGHSSDLWRSPSLPLSLSLPLSRPLDGSSSGRRRQRRRPTRPGAPVAPAVVRVSGGPRARLGPSEGRSGEGSGFLREGASQLLSRDR